MSEKEPKNTPRFWLNLNGERRECTPDNTLAFIHENEEHDHIYLIDGEEEGAYIGRFVWRDFIQEGGQAFDDMIKYMINQGYVVEDNGTLDENDMKAYLLAHPDKISVKTYDVTPRQMGRVAFLAYILGNGHLTPDDFSGTGELHI